jgi:hypothetical protein
MFKSLNYLKSNILKSFVYLILFIFLLFIFPDLAAKTTCTGKACEIIPSKYKSELENIDSAMQTQYIKPLLNSMIDSAIISNNMNGLIGSGYMNRFQIGAGVSVGAVKKDDIHFTYADINIPKLPNAGISVSPSIMFGFNLGWILGKGAAINRTTNESKKEEDEDEDEKSFLHRFNFYFHGMKTGYSISEMKAAYGNKPELSGSAKVESIGFMLRYQIIEPKFIPSGFIGFNGVSIGAGFNSQYFSLDASHQPRTNPTVNFGELRGSWIARTQFEFSSSVKSVPIDIRTGLKLFYLFDIFLGGGFSRNIGEANLHLQRSGPIKLSLDPLQVYNANITTTDTYRFIGNNNSNLDGNFSVDIRNKAKISNTIVYGIFGFEVNLLFLKIVAEGLVMDKSYGASLGCKFSF